MKTILQVRTRKILRNCCKAMVYKKLKHNGNTRDLVLIKNFVLCHYYGTNFFIYKIQQLSIRTTRGESQQISVPKKKSNFILYSTRMI